MALAPINAVTSPLDPASHAAISHIWDGLGKAFGIVQPYVHPIPHVTWHVAEAYDWKRLRDALFHVAQDYAPFRVRTGGLGVFSLGAKPILHLPLVRTDAMSRLHRDLFTTLAGVGTGVHPLYAPDAWIPHVTLAHTGVTLDNLPGIVTWLAERPFIADVQIHKLELIGRDESGPLQHVFELGRP